MYTVCDFAVYVIIIQSRKNCFVVSENKTLPIKADVTDFWLLVHKCFLFSSTFHCSERMYDVHIQSYVTNTERTSINPVIVLKRLFHCVIANHQFINSG